LARSLLRSAAAVLAVLLVGCGSKAATDTAASVNGQKISMAAYSQQVRYMRRTTAQAQMDVCVPKALASLCHKLKQSALDTLIKEELVRQYARAHHITVSNADYNREWALVMSQFHGQVPVLQAYVKGRGISVAAFQAMVRQDLLQQAVMYRITKNMPRSVPSLLLSRIFVAKEKDAAEVRRLLKGESFHRVAVQLNRRNGSLCRRVGCGQPAWLPDAFVGSKESSVLHARPGAIVGPFYETNSIVFVQVAGRVNRHRLAAAQELSLRTQIFNRWLSNQQRRAAVRRYVVT
jgi:hypothetical protein